MRLWPRKSLWIEATRRARATKVHTRRLHARCMQRTKRLSRHILPLHQRQYELNMVCLPVQLQKLPPLLHSILKPNQTLIGIPTPGQLTCDNYPFFESMQPLPANIKAFYNKVLAVKGNIFQVCQVSCVRFKRLRSLAILLPSSRDKLTYT